MQAGFSVSKHLISGNRSENQDQPSPVSVLETQFEEDEHTATESSGNSKPEEHGTFGVQHVVLPFLFFFLLWWRNCYIFYFLMKQGACR